MRWRYDDSDIAPGTRIVAIFTPFLLDLLHRKPSEATFNRQRDNFWLVGGEIIQRRRIYPDLERLPLDTLIGELVEATVDRSFRHPYPSQNRERSTQPAENCIDSLAAQTR